jgi:hypothetical protein
LPSDPVPPVMRMRLPSKSAMNVDPAKGKIG